MRASATSVCSGKVHLLRLSGLSQMAKRSRQHESKQEAKRLEEVLVRNIMKVKARKGQLDGVKTEGGKDGEAKK